MDRWRHPLKDGRTVVIRRADERDAEAMLRNMNSVGAEIDWILTESFGTEVRREREWIRGFDDLRSVLYVAEVDGQVVGQADAHISPHAKARHVASIGIAIVNDHRELGIGRALMEHLLEWMKRRGVAKAVLEVFSTNARAIALYRKLGFEEEGRRRRHFKVRGEYVDNVLMAKWLT